MVQSDNATEPYLNLRDAPLALRLPRRPNAAEPRGRRRSRPAAQARLRGLRSRRRRRRWCWRFGTSWLPSASASASASATSRLPPASAAASCRRGAFLSCQGLRELLESKWPAFGPTLVSPPGCQPRPPFAAVVPPSQGG